MIRTDDQKINNINIGREKELIARDVLVEKHGFEFKGISTIAQDTNFHWDLLMTDPKGCWVKIDVKTRSNNLHSWYSINESVYKYLDFLRNNDNVEFLHRMFLFLNNDNTIGKYVKASKVMNVLDNMTLVESNFENCQRYFKLDINSI